MDPSGVKNIEFPRGLEDRGVAPNKGCHKPLARVTTVMPQINPWLICLSPPTWYSKGLLNSSADLQSGVRVVQLVLGVIVLGFVEIDIYHNRQ